MRRDVFLPVNIHERLATLGGRLKTCPDVVFAYLFGGLAGKKPRPFSDVDVAVYLEDAEDPIGQKWALIRRITAHLGTDRVDLVVLNEAPTALVGRILQTRRVLYDRDPLRRQGFESLALREFFDFRVFEHRLLSRRYTGG